MKNGAKLRTNKNIADFRTKQELCVIHELSGLERTPKFSSWGKEVLCQVVDVDPITVFENFKNG